MLVIQEDVFSLASAVVIRSISLKGVSSGWLEVCEGVKDDDNGVRSIDFILLREVFEGGKGGEVDKEVRLHHGDVSAPRFSPSLKPQNRRLVGKIREIFDCQYLQVQMLLICFARYLRLFVLT